MYLAATVTFGASSIELSKFIPIAADWLTIVAAVIAIAGIASAYWSRPRVLVTATNWGAESATIIVRNAAGTASIRDLLTAKGMLDEQGHRTTWDGSEDWTPAVGPNQQVVLELSDRSDPGPNQREPRADEFFHDIGAQGGFIMDVSWRAPLVPWLSKTIAVLWTNDSRRAGLAPVVLLGGAARGALAYARANEAHGS